MFAPYALPWSMPSWPLWLCLMLQGAHCSQDLLHVSGLRKRSCQLDNFGHLDREKMGKNWKHGEKWWKMVKNRGKLGKMGKIPHLAAKMRHRAHRTLWRHRFLQERTCCPSTSVYSQSTANKETVRKLDWIHQDFSKWYQFYHVILLTFSTELFFSHGLHRTGRTALAFVLLSLFQDAVEELTTGAEFHDQVDL